MRRLENLSPTRLQENIRAEAVLTLPQEPSLHESQEHPTKHQPFPHFDVPGVQPENRRW
jgi:hypothetical protein